MLCSNSILGLAIGAIAGDANTAMAVYGNGTANSESMGYAEIVNSTALNPMPPFSVEFWAKPDQTEYTPTVVSSFKSATPRRGWLFYQATGSFGITVLAEDQHETSGRFASKVADKFEGETWVPAPVTGSPP